MENKAMEPLTSCIRYDGNSCSGIDWEQRRYELSKAAMQGILSNPHCNTTREKIAEIAIKCADEVIKQLKENKVEK